MNQEELEKKGKVGSLKNTENEGSTQNKENIQNKQKTQDKENTQDKQNTQNTKNEAESQKNSQKTQTKSPLKKAFNAIRIAIETVIWIGIIGLSILLVMVMVSQKTDVFGHRLYVILTGSMEPTIHISQAIITQEVKDPQVGDIIAFGEDDFITVHRITKVYTEGDKKLYQTKGDFNNAEDKELVKPETIKGKVKYILPGVGEAILYFQSHKIVLVVAFIVLLLIILVRRLVF